jgi:hypothetical protein
MWDDFYGKQNNPYDADDFKLILFALKALVENCPDGGLEELSSLIRLTKEALKTELGDESFDHSQDLD